MNSNVCFCDRYSFIFSSYLMCSYSSFNVVGACQTILNCHETQATEIKFLEAFLDFKFQTATSKYLDSSRSTNFNNKPEMCLKVIKCILAKLIFNEFNGTKCFLTSGFHLQYYFNFIFFCRSCIS